MLVASWAPNRVLQVWQPASPPPPSRGIWDGGWGLPQS